MQKENIITEFWKDVKGYEGHYQISNFGNVKSMERIVVCGHGGSNLRKEKIMTHKKGRKGYYYVQLYKNGQMKQYSIHRLVANHFLNLRKGFDFVDHIDGNKSNNHFSNLEWVTNKENKLRSVRLKTHAFGVKIYTNKLSEKDVVHIRKEFYANSDTKMQKTNIFDKLSSGYNVSRVTIKEICNNKKWKHLL